MQRNLITATLFAGVLAVGAAHAQSVVTPPATAGQPSTESRAGVPNPTQRPDGSMPASREAVKSEARVQNRNPANSNTPGGEPSTMTNNQPNATPQVMSGTTRSEVRQDALKTKPQFGQKGERPDVPTNPKTSTGTPK
ncbi:serine/threonine protein kinase [Variovorax guangxiensis]|uniref:Serine/threonine protein kinase n=1 Tax=Variovorax guangxiensis TaxID=1775474 RepID=A0A502DUV3_9BURK|nr:serine/threonine protein kinase [Variovorax guangxiensis]RZI65820.1 MAG: serine/threonine protein kinase [Variovorax sp.]TPG24983.1 serine/threonine protein kinase [Variovorax ginsengisoli]TPG29235.1 serine/threonine protein kinase [Variovorax guangxiensis]